MFALGLFLLPMSAATGRSRTGISTAALLNSTLGMALGPLAGGWVYDAFGSYAWLFIGSCGVGLGAVAIACTFRPLHQLPTALPSLSAAH
jgi:hypothetical protein